jgi:hypothetical protein
VFFKQNAPQFPPKNLKARYARAATQQAATRRNPMLGELFQAGSQSALWRHPVHFRVEADSFDDMSWSPFRVRMDAHNRNIAD